MQTTPTNKQKAEAAAIERGAAALALVDLHARCATLKLAPPAGDGSVRVRVLGQDLVLTPPRFDAIIASTGKAAKPADRLLAIHYLLRDVPVEPAGHWISFREFPGGQFYFEPFRSRSIKPLVARIGNNLDLLKNNLARLQWQAADLPDLSAQIHALGAINALLVYHQGDEELEPTAELLFDACAKRALCAEDAAVLAGRICLSLL